jgi:UDP-N-acetylmuramyl pentapeptide phosphotransferase/UDP-N-acetylglucosamine-1-phosphate transferase
MKTFACVYFGSALVAMFLVPLVTRIARKRGLMDAPGLRKVHKAPVPRVGGIVLVAAVLALTIPVLFLDNSIGLALRKIQTKILFLLGTGFGVFLMGLLDDVLPGGIRASFKLMVLVGASIIVSATGARIESVTVDGLFTLDFGWLSWPLTTLWIVGVTVGMNFLDGLDGLAAGTAAIVTAVIVVFALYTGQIAMAVLMLAVLGSLTGFLFFNFNPAKVFMGDCGSMFLGFMIGAGSVVCVAKAATLVGMALPLLALGVPILDTLLTVIRRGVVDRRSLFAAERGHIHHRLLDKGLNQRRAVFVIYGATLTAAATGLCMLVTRSVGSAVLFCGVLVFLFLVFHFAGSTQWKEIVAALHRNSIIKHQARLDRMSFEDSQLQMREAVNFDDWWKGLCTLAERMEFEKITLAVDDVDSAGRRSWNRTQTPLAPEESISMTIPIHGSEKANHGNGSDVDGQNVVSNGHSAQLEIVAKVNGSLEGFGRRVMFFGRLIDEYRPAFLKDGMRTLMEYRPMPREMERLRRMPESARREKSHNSKKTQEMQ